MDSTSHSSIDVIIYSVKAAGNIPSGAGICCCFLLMAVQGWDLPAPQWVSIVSKNTKGKERDNLIMLKVPMKA